jgi:hypothetical protein
VPGAIFEDAGDTPATTAEKSAIADFDLDENWRSVRAHAADQLTKRCRAGWSGIERRWDQ